MNQKPADGIFNPGLVFFCGKIKDLKIFFVPSFRVPILQKIVGHSKVAAGKKIFPVPIVLKCTRLAHQPVYDMPILDIMFLGTHHPRHIFHFSLGIPDFQVIRVNSDIRLFSNQTAVYRVHVFFDTDGAAVLDLKYKGPAVGEQKIPADVLFCDN